MADIGLGAREGENATRAGRLKKLKKGPGVFIYNGGAFDVEYVPTPKLTPKNEPVLGADGLPVLDGGGRQVFKPAGTIVTDDNGQVVLGGIPKQVKHKIEVYKLRGVEFPEGKRVSVNASVALKLRCLACFDEVDDGAEAMPEEATPVDGLAKRGRKKKSEVEN